MSRMRHFSASEDPKRNEEESSDDDDAFTALSRKRPRAQPPVSEEEAVSKRALDGDASDHHRSREEVGDPKRPVAQTSSTKRHHGAVSDARKAKMDAILLELEAETTSTLASTNGKPYRRTQSQSSRTGGSFVDPGDEHCTTNIFVGNLAPNITEEQMTELFRQFGEPLLLLTMLVRILYFIPFRKYDSMSRRVLITEISLLFDYNERR